MKKQILTIVLAITTLTAFAQVPSYVPTNGLVGYWPFNGNANDESGNGNNGTVNGATLTSDRNGVANKAYSFDGVNNSISVIMNSSTNIISDITISCWFKPINHINNQQQLVFFGDYQSEHDPYSIAINSNNYYYFRRDVSNGSTITKVESPLINQNLKYQHILGKYNSINGKMKIYIDGECKDSINIMTPINYSTNNMRLFFGSVDNGNDQLLNGNLDDIAIYNRDLTEQEITALYNGCTSPTATITPQSTTTFCQGGSVILNASTGSGYTYEWYKNGNIINGSITSSYTANQSGSYTVKVINGSCNATSSATTVTVNPNPTVSLSLANFIHIKESPVTLAGSPSGGTYSGAGVVGSTFSSTNAGLGKKTITYNYTTGAGCSGSATAITTVYDTTACSTFDTLFINIAVAGLIAPNNLGTLKIWPNPANDHITIDNGNFSILNGYSVKIETVLGQEVFKSAINQQQFSVDLTTWNGKGVYLVHVLDNQNNIIETKKIVLQ
jgi:hypothetical protein